MPVLVRVGGRGKTSPGTCVAAERQVPVQTWASGEPGLSAHVGWALPTQLGAVPARRGEPGPGAGVAGVGPIPAQMWPGWAQSRRRCGCRTRPLNSAGLERHERQRPVDLLQISKTKVGARSGRQTMLPRCSRLHRD